MLLAAVLLLGLCSPTSALPGQVVLDAPPSDAQLQSLQPTDNRRLHGRFLHITDLHPDPYYKPGSDPSSACHRGKTKKKHRAGYYGAAYKECDSPFQLTNFTLDYLDEHWSNEIDFVIWTGDNARHDNDDKIPRPLDEIYDLNQAVAEKVERVFSNRGIPVIPTIGNNDVWRPNDITRTYSSIWSNFIPPESRASFLHGGYFSVEVIPDALAVISLNTMYFYDSNEAIQGCPRGDDHDPGNQQFDWLEDQLAKFRSRHMHVWVIGHVPPTDGHYRSRCYGRYVELSLRFQATILGHLYGHLNTDHFYFLQADDLSADGEGTSVPAKGASSSLFDTLVADFSQLPDGKKEIDYGEYAVVNVNPSVVPNPYVPGFRVYAYNTTGLDDVFVREADTDEYRRGGNVLPRKESPRRHGNAGGTAAKCESPDRGGPGGCSVGAGWQPDVGGPSVRNSLWTPLGYAQYWMPRLKEFDGTHEPEYELEYLTFSLSRLHPGGEKGVAGQASDPQPPIPMANLPEALRDPKVKQSKYAPYGLDDLTIPSWLDLARRIGRGKEKKLRKRFRKYMYVGGDES